jgi:hypothetical protein
VGLFYTSAAETRGPIAKGFEAMRVDLPSSSLSFKRGLALFAQHFGMRSVLSDVLIQVKIVAHLKELSFYVEYERVDANTTVSPVLWCSKQAPCFIRIVCVRSCHANRSLLLQVGFGYMYRHFFMDDLAAEAGLEVLSFVSMLQPFLEQPAFHRIWKTWDSKCQWDEV